MRILKEGDMERAWHDDLRCMVDIVYQRRWFRYRSEDVDVLTIVGVYEPTDEVMLIPPQATPDIAAAIRAKAKAEGREVPVRQPVPLTLAQLKAVAQLLRSAYLAGADSDAERERLRLGMVAAQQAYTKALAADRAARLTKRLATAGEEAH